MDYESPQKQLIDSYKYELIKREKKCSNSRFDILFDHVITPNNEEIKDYLIVKPKICKQDKTVGVCVVPIFKKKFCLMKGWRHQFKEFIYQAPAGFVEKGEEPFETAVRELKEETSLLCEPENLISLGSFIPDSGLIEGRVALFLALNCKTSSSKIENEIGSSKLFFIKRKSIKELIVKEKNIGGSTLVTLLRSILYLDNQF